MAQIAIFIAFILYLLLASPAYAARSISISADDTALFGDEETEITITPSGFSDGETIYIKGAFYQDGSINYFGFTKNGDTWIKNGASTANQPNAKIGQWNNKISVKSDFSDSGYKGEGDYLFKVGFYYTTSGGNLSAVNWSTNSIAFTINEPDPSPQPSPSPFSPKSPSPTPTITLIAKTIQSPSPTKSISQSPELVLAESSQSATPSATPSNFESPPAEVKNPQGNNSKIPDMLISGGLILSGFSLGAYLWYKHLQH